MKKFILQKWANGNICIEGTDKSGFLIILESNSRSVYRSEWGKEFEAIDITQWLMSLTEGYEILGIQTLEDDEE